MNKKNQKQKIGVFLSLIILEPKLKSVKHLAVSLSVITLKCIHKTFKDNLLVRWGNDNKSDILIPRKLKQEDRHCVQD